jgi:hypothetical protein
VDHVIGWIAPQDLGQAVLNGHRLPLWADGQVGVGEGVGNEGVLGLKLCGEFASQAASLCLDDGCSVVCNEPAEAVGGAE